MFVFQWNRIPNGFNYFIDHLRMKIAERVTFSRRRKNYWYYSAGDVGMDYASLNCLFEMKDTNAILDTVLDLCLIRIFNIN